MSQKPLVIGNWKMNHDYVEALHLTQQIGVVLKNKSREHVDIVVSPPFVDIRSVGSIIESERIPISLGAQHASMHESGAYTGEVSVSMLKRLGVKSVIVGHSERRLMYGQSDEIVAATVQAVTRSGLEAVLCCGENEVVRDAGEHLEFVALQIEKSLTGLDKRLASLITVAYEPIWAIGTGRTASSEQVAEMMQHLRALLQTLGLSDVRVLYGGSVNGENADELLTVGHAGGFLVGGASLKVESFMAIIEAVDDCYARNR
jgi:triosephosphate isomerase (TIM)